MRASVAVVSAWVAAGHTAFCQCSPEQVASPTPWDRGLFGRLVQISGDVAVVADRGDDTFCTTPLCGSGAVHAFRKVAGGWEFEATIYHSRISPYDGFGAALAIDGPSRFVATSGGDAAIYFFEHNGEAWHEVAELVPTEYGVGAPLVLRGDTLIAGQHSKACWVYRQRNGRWEFDQKLPAPPSPSFTWFSDAIAFDGEWLAVGAPHDSTLALRVGLVHLYRRDGSGQFDLVQTLAPPEPARTQQGFGTAVAIAKNVLVVGAPFLDGRVGAAFTYELIDGRWMLADELRGAAAISDFGASAAMDDDVVIVGAPGESVPGVSFGAAYTFQRRADGTWRQAGRLLPAPSGAQFGWSVATDGQSAIVGAPNTSVAGREQPGAAFLYDLPCLLCRVDVDGDGELTIFDFLAFGNLFAAGDPAADFDASGVLDFFDFLAFQNEFTAGCA